MLAEHRPKKFMHKLFIKNIYEYSKWPDLVLRLPSSERGHSCWRPVWQLRLRFEAWSVFRRDNQLPVQRIVDLQRRRPPGSHRCQSTECQPETHSDSHTHTHIESHFRNVDQGSPKYGQQLHGLQSGPRRQGRPSPMRPWCISPSASDFTPIFEKISDSVENFKKRFHPPKFLMTFS